MITNDHFRTVVGSVNIGGGGQRVTRGANGELLVTASGGGGGSDGGGGGGSGDGGRSRCGAAKQGPFR